MSAPLVIIGSGLGGYMLAKEFRRLDKETPLTIITEDDGAFYSKPLLSTALTQQKTAEALVMNTAEAMAEQLNARVLTHTTVQAIQLESNHIATRQGDIPYGRLVLALGAEKISAPLQGDGVDEVVSVNNLMEYATFRQWLQGKRSIVMLGAGLVGCEFSNDLLNAGLQLHCVALEAEPLMKWVPVAIGRQLRLALAERGVQWHLQRMAQQVERVGNQFRVVLDDGSNIIADGVFAAIGLRSRTQLAKQSGLVVNRGIVVDEFCRSSHADVYALGDCAERDGQVLMYVAPLLQSAKALAATLAGTPTAVEYPPMPIVIKTPACPLATIPPSSDSGAWQLEGEAPHLVAGYYEERQLMGFALSGDKVRERAQYVKQLTSKLPH